MLGLPCIGGESLAQGSLDAFEVRPHLAQVDERGGVLSLGDVRPLGLRTRLAQQLPVQFEHLGQPDHRCVHDVERVEVGIEQQVRPVPNGVDQSMGSGDLSGTVGAGQGLAEVITSSDSLVGVRQGQAGRALGLQFRGIESCADRSDGCLKRDRPHGADLCDAKPFGIGEADVGHRLLHIESGEEADRQ